MVRLSAPCIAVAILLLGSATLPAASSLAVSAEELAASVTIHRDEWGVPHVFGPTDESVIFGYMYAQAEDNFWQIEDSMIQALGRTSDLEGEAGMRADLLNRALEIPRLSKEEWERTPVEMQSLITAGVAGGPGPLGIVFNFYTRPQAGAKRRYGVAGTSFASVVEFGEPVEARSILVFGGSADESSPHYFDQAHLFAGKKFKQAWFDPEGVVAHAKRSYHHGS
jgi:acyl-homoserine lactone acylase PvdQ